jgi:hypothetical protein
MGPEYNSARAYLLATYGKRPLRYLEDLVVLQRWYAWVTSYKGDRTKLPDSQRQILKTMQDVLSSLSKHFDKNTRGIARVRYLAEKT